MQNDFVTIGSCLIGCRQIGGSLESKSARNQSQKWSCLFFLRASVGKVTEKMIEAYIAHQEQA
jgi:REP element-mobilizing transposase RayT